MMHGQTQIKSFYLFGFPALSNYFPLTFRSLTTYIYIYIYMSTAQLTSRRYILNIYSTNIHTEYFKHAA